jgi:hypothetical protein
VIICTVISLTINSCYFVRGKIDIPIRLGIELFELIMGVHIRWKFKRVLRDLYFRYVDPGPVDFHYQ